jgi:hypothetical protein
MYGRGGAISAREYGVITRRAAPPGTHALGRTWQHTVDTVRVEMPQSNGERGGGKVLKDPQWWDGCVAGRN